MSSTLPFRYSSIRYNFLLVVFFRQSEEAKREKQNRKDHWLHKNIVVKITTSKLGEKFNKKKAIVTEVVDLYGAVVRLVGQTDKAAVCQLDQSHVETVLPAIGKHVRVVNGAYRGELATLDKINESAFNARIVIAAVSTSSFLLIDILIDWIE